MWADTHGVFCPYSPAAAVDLPETNTFFFFLILVHSMLRAATRFHYYGFLSISEP